MSHDLTKEAVIELTLNFISSSALRKRHSGLKVFVHVLDKMYQTGRKATEAFKQHMPIIYDKFLSQWNYRAVPALLHGGKVI
jgi:hypothetical protein